MPIEIVFGDGYVETIIGVGWDLVLADSCFAITADSLDVSFFPETIH